ncbi:MAG TPA: DUF4148 domain-containing protein [Noviherbaspirillum sp.]|uniref:DUF4148 domain-containing protein n=1 Tax=Noviherbaspirillum sp. TaxID=1926288 RepID=UPI002D5F19C5|nr:DUF4148 domain-containing protein [Noviherbaspirillum sp.]HYD94375.1 DUF4148 domain-containing protein [Noviherbaspirillum sp.]
MNTKNLIIAASLFAAAGSVLAENIAPYVDQTQFTGTRTRAEVIAELNSETADEKLARRAEYVDQARFVGTKTRAEVLAELESEYAADRYAGTRSPEYVEHAKFVSTRSRDEVRKEAIQAAKGVQTKGSAIGG